MPVRVLERRDPPVVRRRCLEAAVRLGVRGPRVFDIQIGLMCLEAGVTELLTRDTGFVALPGLRLVDPFVARSRR